MTLSSDALPPRLLGMGPSEAAVASAAAACNRYSNLEQIYLRERFADAHKEARAKDALAATGIHPPLARLTLAVKACFDVAGWVTDAASAAFASNPSAKQDAPLVSFLRAQGATVVGHSNMTEFAFGALGVNTFRGTPRTPLDPTGERLAGGSTSGGAVAVATGMADVALGSDTSGSVRIPAAFCGLVGFKPSRGRLSTHGCIPLSSTFDVPGFITRDVPTLLQVTDTFDAFKERRGLGSRYDTIAGTRFALPLDFATGDCCDRDVQKTFERALNSLSRAGAIIVETKFTDLRAASRVAVEGGIIIADAYAWHRPWIHERMALYDPLVGPRILLGEAVPAHRYLQALVELEELSRIFDAEMAPFAALLTPTVPILPPRLSEVAEHGEYLRLNALTFSLAELANRIDAPSISLPLHGDAPEPIGLMLTARRGHDRNLLTLAAAVAKTLA